MLTPERAVDLSLKRCLVPSATVGGGLPLKTTILFRITVLATLLVIAGFGYLLYQNDRRLADSIEQESRKIEAVAVMLAQTREDALTPDDFASLRDAFENQVLSTEQRLGTLEQRAGAPTRVIAASIRSVAFLQGAYGLRHVESGKILRHALGPNGENLKTHLASLGSNRTGQANLQNFNSPERAF